MIADWVQGQALLCTIYVQSIGAVSMFFTQKSRGGRCPSRRVIKVVSLTCFRSGNKKTALLNVRRNMVQGHALLCTIYIQSIGGVSMFFTQKSRGGKCPSRRVIKVVSLTCFRSGNKKITPLKRKA